MGANLIDLIGEQMESINIYQRINKVMKAVKYVKKDALVQGYKAVTHDQVISVARQALVDNGVVIYPSQCGDSQISAIFKPTGEATNIIRYVAVYNINFVNMDNPDDRITVTVESHANDNGDKAPGKALTYATKTALLKVLCLETGENDESRTSVFDISSDIEAIENATTMDGLRSAFESAFNRNKGKRDNLIELSKAKDEAKRRLSK